MALRMTRAATLTTVRMKAVDEGDDHQIVACCQGFLEVVEQHERPRPGELQQVRLNPFHRRDDEDEEKRHQEEDRASRMASPPMTTPRVFFIRTPPLG
jgi:hypothetical protein